MNTSDHKILSGTRLWWVALVITLLTGIALGRFTAGNGTDADTAEASANGTADRKASGGAGTTNGGRSNASPLGGPGSGTHSAASVLAGRDALSDEYPPSGEALLDLIRGSRDPANQQAMLLMAANLSSDEIEGVLNKLLEEGLNGYTKNVMRDILSVWARQDGAKAMEFVETAEGGLNRDQAVSTVLRQWAVGEPATAMKWIQDNVEFHNDNDRRKILTAFAGWGEGDPYGAFKYIGQMEEMSIYGTSIQDYAYGFIFAEMKIDGRFDEALGWINSLPDGEQRSMALARYGQSLAGSDINSALALLDRESAAGKDTGLMRSRIVDSWAKRDPGAAADFVLTSEGHDGWKQQKLRSVVNDWANRDLEKVGEWLVQFEPSPVLDSAVETYVYRASRYDPPGAMGWAESITNSDQRENSMRNVYRNWRGQDNDAARKYIQNSPALTDQQKENILRH